VAGSPATGLRIGASVTLTELAATAAVAESFPALAHAAESVSTQLLRNMGTLGGNLSLDTRCTYYDQSYEWRKSIDFCMKCDGSVCWVALSSPTCLAVQSSDTAPLLCALGAKLTLVSVRGERVIEATELYRDDGIRYLSKNPDEILTSIQLPPVNGTRSAYWKLRRRGSFDFPILGVAARLDLDGGGTIRAARLFLGGVGSRPIEVLEANSLLTGEPGSEELFARAGQLAAKVARPFDNTDLEPAWRKQMAAVYTVRALREAAGTGPTQGPA
jgi:4-hydroxybenzoyl-CoA reductase subunit beta